MFLVLGFGVLYFHNFMVLGSKELLVPKQYRLFSRVSSKVRGRLRFVFGPGGDPCCLFPAFWGSLTTPLNQTGHPFYS